jgi:hypothetical protein
MKINIKEIGQELKSVLTGNTLDALLLPLAFALTNAFFGLTTGAMAALGLGFLLMLIRLARKQAWTYTLAGMALVGVATGLSLLTKDAVNYFLPALITSSLLVLAALTSLILGKPLAAWASHLTRGWPLDWFWRDDVRPAYSEVTWAWMIFFLLRLGLQLTLYLQGQVSTLAWTESLLGWPVTLIILVSSYIYGIWRLRQLGGPGVDEFIAQTPPPWQGQTRGF